ncbi:hypothetical protein [Proteiniborus sp.]|uniref:hypothetical protein n=1 Tax=Proteiniborus sp. TaxID=2079015 RepID=UPI003318A7A7
MDTLSCNTVEFFELDLDIYNNIFKNSPRIIENMESFKKTISTFEKLSEDMYLSLFKKNIVFKAMENISPEYWFNSVIIKKLFEIDEFEDLKQSCSLNFFKSILATDLLGQELIKSFKELAMNSKAFSAKLNNQVKYIEEYRRDKDSKEKDTISLGAIKNKILNNINDIDKYISDHNLVYTSVSEALKQFLATFKTIATWGFDDNRLTPTSYEEKIEVSAKLRTLRKVKDISEMAGRFKESASELQRKKVKEEGLEVCGVELGNEIHKILPSEKLFLARESTKKSFYKKLTQKELLSYKYKNNRAKSKGPIICCIDTSGSMEGELEVWSKSVAISLLDIAIKQKREFVAIMFSNKVYKVLEFTKHRIEPNKLYELATFFYGSGTNFIEPLEKSIELISSARYKYADIVFITDGKAYIEPEFVEEFLFIKEKKEFRMITVNVSDEIEEGLNQINDTQILLSALTEEEIEEANNTLFAI